MTTTYKIIKNSQYNSNEIYFSGKPSEEVRKALKTLRFRWNGKKSCWYGFANENAIISAINSATPADETGGTLSDGYMGAIRWDGVKSHKSLYGSDLSAAIRADIKKAGIKGATVSVKSYSGGQSITVKARINPNEYTPESEYIERYQIEPDHNWIYTDERTQPIFYTDYFSMDAQEREKIRILAAKYSWKCATTHQSCYGSVDRLDAITEPVQKRLRMIVDILESYHYDDSNGMVDYFDTNFYWDIEVIPA